MLAMHRGECIHYVYFVFISFYPFRYIITRSFPYAYLNHSCLSALLLFFFVKKKKNKVSVYTCGSFPSQKRSALCVKNLVLLAVQPQRSSLD